MENYIQRLNCSSCGQNRILRASRVLKNKNIKNEKPIIVIVKIKFKTNLFTPQLVSLVKNEWKSCIKKRLHVL